MEDEKHTNPLCGSARWSGARSLIGPVCVVTRWVAIPYRHGIVLILVTIRARKGGGGEGVTS